MPILIIIVLIIVLNNIFNEGFVFHDIYWTLTNQWEIIIQLKMSKRL